jgi:hypothetical protein
MGWQMERINFCNFPGISDARRLITDHALPSLNEMPLSVMAIVSAAARKSANAAFCEGH